MDGNNMGAVHVIMKRKYRQYMNRKGGFNRPLDFVAWMVQGVAAVVVVAGVKSSVLDQMPTDMLHAFLEDLVIVMYWSLCCVLWCLTNFK